MKTKRVIPIVLALAMLFSLLPSVNLTAYAKGNIAEGDGWSISSDYVLTVSATFETVPADYAAPWQDYSDDVKEIVLAEGVKTMEWGTFEKWPSLKKVTLPDSLEWIGAYVLCGCTSLVSVTIPKNVSRIDAWAFSACDSLPRIDVSPENQYFTNDSQGAVYDKAMSTIYYCPAPFVGTFELPASVTSILHGGVFFRCNNLTAIHTPSENSTFKSVDGVLFSKDGTTLAAYPSGAGGLYIVPDGVKTIDSNAFRAVAGLTGVVFPASLEKIGFYAFEECVSLKTAAFMGDAPYLETSEFIDYANTVFQHYSTESGGYINIPGLKLYYIEGKNGWTSPTWNDFPTATWDGEHIPGTAPSDAFGDIPETAWYKSAVDYAVENGLMNGMGNGEFQPDEPTTRAMVVTILYRLSGSSSKYENNFSDVLNNNWYTDAISWAAYYGIVNGMTAATFEPETSMTREMLAVILYRYTTKKTDADTSKKADLSVFPDESNVSPWAKEAMQWAVANGIVNGVGDGKTTYLQPLGNATRAQVAAIFQRYIENVLNK